MVISPDPEQWLQGFIVIRVADDNTTKNIWLNSKNDGFPEPQQQIARWKNSDQSENEREGTIK